MAIFYPLSAGINLFCGILLDPADQQIQGDLGLIQSIPQVARDMRSCRVTPHDEQYLTALDLFIAELVRIGNCAIIKVKLAVKS